MQEMQAQDRGELTKSLKRNLIGSKPCQCGKTISANKEFCFSCLQLKTTKEVQTNAI